MKQLSRRSALFSAAIVPAAVLSSHVQIAGAAPAADPELLALGRQFDAVAARLDHGDSAWETLEGFGRIYDEIVATPARTIEGLFVKARVECWGLLGDLDAGQSNGNMALSIIRDLIRLHDPRLERPGAIKRLVEEIEKNAAPPSRPKPD
jgi:hypothetical protein